MTTETTLHWRDQFREYFDKCLKPKKPTMKNLDREILIDFISRVESEAIQRAIGAVPGNRPIDPDLGDRDYLIRGFNLCRSQTLQSLHKLLESGKEV